jgi:5-methylcytosine-specific restriction endonuclease McrA
MTNWEHKTRVRALRRKSAKHLQKLVEFAQYRCHWCHLPIVCVSSIEPSQRLAIKDGMITYRIDDNIVTISIATVDHVRPLNDGGDSGPDNLVASCERCNNSRNKNS